MSAERDRMTFGALLDALLGESNLTCAALGEALRDKPASKADVWKWTKGAMPPPRRVPAILDALGCSSEDRVRLLRAYCRETSALPVGDLSTEEIRQVADASERLRAGLPASS